MATVRKTITLTEQQNEWIKAQLVAGDYTNDSEYLRDLIRREQERSSRIHLLKAAVEEGINSGISDRTPEQIMEAVESKMRADGRL